MPFLAPIESQLELMRHAGFELCSGSVPSGYSVQSYPPFAQTLTTTPFFSRGYKKSIDPLLPS
jgi:hypothetical protein